jgi:TonB family protein
MAASESKPAPALRLLVELESWPRAFLGNFRDLLGRGQLPPLKLDSAPAPFWPDVFVTRPLPWRRFFESGALHLVLLALLFVASRFVALQPRLTPLAILDHAQVIYYKASEYLPPLDTRPLHRGPEQKADPEFSRQPVISVPAEADNRAQTIVAPNNLKLKRDVPLPNIVAWSDQSQLPIPPTPSANLSRRSADLSNSVIAPPPDPSHIKGRSDPLTVEQSVVAPPPDAHLSSPKQGPEIALAAVIAPPPSVETSARRVADLNIGHASVIAPAPQLAVSEQRAFAGSGASSGKANGAPQVVPPPPSLGPSGSAHGGGRAIALNLHPAVGAPPEPPAGNRRGSFAATPAGHAGASGTPGSSSGNPNNTAGNGGGRNTGDLPSGLYVGSAPNQPKTGSVAGDPAGKSAPSGSVVNPKLTASVRPPRMAQSESDTKLSAAEREVFGDRRFYSLTLNMPNLNSASGSWVVRFAELRHDATPGDLASPTAVHKVDPAYPLELMRQGVAGTVMLYAVIHADGTVGNVRVLRSIDERLDQFASEALVRWQFRPATRNGNAVDLEAVFQIPFHPAKVKPNF